MTRKELTEEALSLPVEDRALLADALLASLNAPEEEVDQQWAAVARQRREEIRSGAVRPVPADQVFSRIAERFKK